MNKAKILAAHFVLDVLRWKAFFIHWRIPWSSGTWKKSPRWRRTNLSATLKPAESSIVTWPCLVRYIIRDLPFGTITWCFPDAVSGVFNDATTSISSGTPLHAVVVCKEASEMFSSRAQYWWSTSNESSVSWSTEVLRLRATDAPNSNFLLL